MYSHLQFSNYTLPYNDTQIQYQLKNKISPFSSYTPYNHLQQTLQLQSNFTYPYPYPYPYISNTQNIITFNKPNNWISPIKPQPILPEKNNIEKKKLSIEKQILPIEKKKLSIEKKILPVKQIEIIVRKLNKFV
jgi:hypothetical protein